MADKPLGSLGSWYSLVVNDLRAKGVRDLLTGEVFISNRLARQIIGRNWHVARGHKRVIMRELLACGAIVQVNKRLYRIVGHMPRSK